MVAFDLENKDGMKFPVVASAAERRRPDGGLQVTRLVILLATAWPAGDVSEHLTESDLGYLRGVYRTTADAPLIFQQSEIAIHLKQTLKGAE